MCYPHRQERAPHRRPRRRRPPCVRTRLFSRSLQQASPCSPLSGCSAEDGIAPLGPAVAAPIQVVPFAAAPEGVETQQANNNLVVCPWRPPRGPVLPRVPHGPEPLRRTTRPSSTWSARPTRRAGRWRPASRSGPTCASRGCSPTAARCTSTSPCSGRIRRSPSRRGRCSPCTRGPAGSASLPGGRISRGSSPGGSR